MVLVDASRGRPWGVKTPTNMFFWWFLAQKTSPGQLSSEQNHCGLGCIRDEIL